MQRYAITDGAPHARLRAWAQAGVEWIQIREPALSPKATARLAEELAGVCREAASGTRLLVNGLDVEAAMGSGAHGVHLRGGASTADVKAALSTGALVSVSCHTLPEVRQACGGGAHTLLWAPVFGKTVDGRVVVPGSGLRALADACREAGGTPVFALGGVTAQNAQECVEAGAAGVAGIRLFAGEDWFRLRAVPDAGR